MKHVCPGCRRYTVNEDRRRKGDGRLRPVNGAELILAARQAPKVRCACGHTTVLLRGSP